MIESSFDSSSALFPPNINKLLLFSPNNNSIELLNCL